MATKLTLAEAKERLDRLEELVGEPIDVDFQNLIQRCGEQGVQIEILQRGHRDLLLDLEERFSKQRAQDAAIIGDLTERVRVLEGELTLLRRALYNRQAPDEAPATKVKVPDPATFDGARDAKVLENFIWDVDQFLKATRVPEREQVNLISMYLTGDAKLWWRTRVADNQRLGRPGITTWDTMKKELKEQFLPSNTAWIAREKLRRLKHTGTVREYVKEFSSLMLDVRDMTDTDCLFNFLSGLQNWAYMELRRQGVKDLPSAMAAAEALADFRSAYTPSGPDKKKNGDAKQRGWKGKKVEQPMESSQTTSSHVRDVTKPLECFICKGPHMAKACPRRGKISALVTQESASTDEDEPCAARLNPLQLINVITAEGPQVCNLMYVAVQVNGKEVRAMLDTGATNSFVDKRVAERLGLTIVGCSSKIKAVNAGVIPVHGRTDVSLAMDTWTGKCSMLVIDLEGYEMLLGMDFFSSAKVTIMPHLRGMLIGDQTNPCFIPTCSRKLVDKGVELKVPKERRGAKAKSTGASTSSSGGGLLPP